MIRVTIDVADLTEGQLAWLTSLGREFWTPIDYRDEGVADEMEERGLAIIHYDDDAECFRAKLNVLGEATIKAIRSR